MIPARVQKIKLMDLAFNPVQLSVEVLDRWCITLLELVGQKSAMKFVCILHHIKMEGSIIMKQIVIYEQRTRVFHLDLFFWSQKYIRRDKRTVTPVCFTMDYFSCEIKSFVLLARADQVRSCGTRIDGKENIENFHCDALIIPLEKLWGVRSNL